jgi:hypothetical protein
MTFSSEAYLTQLAFWKIIGAVEVGFEIEPFIAKFKEGHEFVMGCRMPYGDHAWRYAVETSMDGGIQFCDPGS